MECSHAHNDLLLGAELVNKPIGIIHKANTGDLRLLAVLVEGEMLNRGRVEHIKVLAVLDGLIEGIVAGASTYLRVDSPGPLLDANSITRVKIFHNWDIGRFDGLDEAHARVRDVALEANL